MRGSTSAILQPDGSLIKGYEYDEFGNLEQSGDAGFLNDVTFTGSVSDTSTGLQYMNARYYNPKTGRFLSQDTYSGNPYDPWTQHLYAYCGNNPTSMIDPTGHFYYLGPTQYAWDDPAHLTYEPESDDDDSDDDDPRHTNPNGRLTPEQIAENATIIYNYLRDEFGWSHNAICAALGNMQGENDTLDPGRKQGSGGGGYGICQWDPGTEKYLAWASENEYEDDSLKGQIKYLQYSMGEGHFEGYEKHKQWLLTRTPKGMDEYKMNSTKFRNSEKRIDFLTKVFGANYIRSSDMSYYGADYDWQKRIDFAEDWDKYFR